MLFKVFRRWVSLGLSVLILAQNSPPAWALPSPCDGSVELTQQAGPYCKAAETADDAVGPQRAIGTIHALVAAFCAAACALEWAGGGAMCQGAAFGGAAANLAVALNTEQQWTTALMGLGPQVILEATALTVTQGLTNTLIYRNYSCFVAGFAGLGSFLSFDGASKSDEAKQRNLQAARTLVGGSDSIVANGSGSGGVPEAGGKTEAGQSGVIPLGKVAEARKAKGSSGVLSKVACDTKGFEGVLSCALAQPDNGLPAFVSSPDFKKNLEKLSGMSADDLVVKGATAEIMQSALGKTLKPEGQEKFAALIRDTRSQMLATEQQSSTLAGKSGAAKPSGLSFALSSGEVAPGAGGAGPETVSFGGSRQPASSRPGDEENPSLSLFVRVSGRYLANRGRVNELEWATLQNRMLMGISATKPAR